jgi:hypothetical protein
MQHDYGRTDILPPYHRQSGYYDKSASSPKGRLTPWRSRKRSPSGGRQHQLLGGLAATHARDTRQNNGSIKSIIFQTLIYSVEIRERRDRALDKSQYRFEFVACSMHERGFIATASHRAFASAPRGERRRANFRRVQDLDVRELQRVLHCGTLTTEVWFQMKTMHFSYD